MAAFIDIVFFSILSSLLAIPLILRFPPQHTHQTVMDVVATLAANHPWLHLAAVLLVAWIALWWAYFIIGWGLLGATPGQWILGLRVLEVVSEMLCLGDPGEGRKRDENLKKGDRRRRGCGACGKRGRGPVFHKPTARYARPLRA